MLLVLSVAGLCILFGPYFWQQAIVRNLRSYGVTFAGAIINGTSLSPFCQWVQKFPGMQGYGCRRHFADLSIHNGLKTEHLPKIMKDLSTLGVDTVDINLTGSNNLIRDVKNSQSKIVCNLTIEHSEISAAAVRSMQGMPELKWLQLSGSKLNHLAFQELGALTGLQGLTLDQTSVTDADLQTLTKLSNLIYISLSNTEVSDAAKAELEQALSDLEITDD